MDQAPSTTNSLNTPAEINLLAENLNRLMLEKGVDTKALHLATGISPSAINGLKRGTGNPTLGTLLELAKFFNLSLDGLIGASKKQTVAPNNQLSVPVYTICNAENRTEHNTLNYLSLNCTKYQEHNLFGIELHNNALSPFYEKGSLFILSTDLKPSDGDIVLVKAEDSSYCFRKVFSIAGKRQFHPIQLDATPHECKGCKVIGVVIRVIQPLY